MAGPLASGSSTYTFPGHGRIHTSLWPPQNIAPPALPYGAHSSCFTFCPPSPTCGLRYFPPPCICTTEGPPDAWSAPIGGHAGPAPR